MRDWDDKDKKREDGIDDIIKKAEGLMDMGNKLAAPSEPMIHLSMSVTFKQLKQLAEALNKT